MSPSKDQAPVKKESVSTESEPQLSKKQAPPKEEELSEEDQHLKDELEMLVERLNEPSQKVELYN